MLKYIDTQQQQQQQQQQKHENITLINTHLFQTTTKKNKSRYKHRKDRVREVEIIIDEKNQFN